MADGLSALPHALGCQDEVLGSGHGNHPTCDSCTYVGRTNCTLTIVDELQRDVEVGLLEHRDDLLQIVALFAGDAHLVALDLGFDGLGALVPDQLGDLLGVFATDALFEAAGDLVGLTGGLRLPPAPWGSRPGGRSLLISV